MGEFAWTNCRGQIVPGRPPAERRRHQRFLGICHQHAAVALHLEHRRAWHRTKPGPGRASTDRGSPRRRAANCPACRAATGLHVVTGLRTRLPSGIPLILQPLSLCKSDGAYQENSSGSLLPSLDHARQAELVSRAVAGSLFGPHVTTKLGSSGDGGKDRGGGGGRSAQWHITLLLAGASTPTRSGTRLTRYETSGPTD